MAENNLMQAIQMYDFYLYELNLYLDTHPRDKQAIALFNKYNKMRESAYEAYVSKYGPITVDQFSGNDCFDWVNAPWPWERSAN